MRPKETLYRLSEPRDIPICKKIWAEHYETKLGKLFWPTVVAERHGKILGFLSTDPNRKFVEVGQIAIAKGVSAIVLMRMLEAYEVVLRMAGVTSYWGYMDHSHKWFNGSCHKFGFDIVKEDDKGVWIQRRLN